MMTIIQFLLVSFLIMRLIHLRGYTHYAAAIDYKSVSMGTNNTFQEKKHRLFSHIFSNTPGIDSFILQSTAGLIAVLSKSTHIQILM